MQRRERNGAPHPSLRVGLPTIEPPRELVAHELDAGGERFALLEWPTPPTSAAPLGALTPAEAATVALAVAGCSNAEIARARNAATRTVANQLASAFRKLRVHSRAELCALAESRRERRGDR